MKNFIICALELVMWIAIIYSLGWGVFGQYMLFFAARAVVLVLAGIHENGLSRG